MVGKGRTVRARVAETTRDPSAAEETFAGVDADTMWGMVMGGSPASDLAVYRQPTFEAAYRRALSEGFAQGPAGYARDTVLAMGRWSFDLAKITVPVDVWYGEQDTTHSPDNGTMLTARIPDARRHVVPGIGGASAVDPRRADPPLPSQALRMISVVP
jgi:pimeloyl-ACP methyl ester carboxylesterase